MQGQEGDRNVVKKAGDADYSFARCLASHTTPQLELAEKENYSLAKKGLGGTLSLKDRNSIMDEVAISRPDRR